MNPLTSRLRAADIGICDEAADRIEELEAAITVWKQEEQEVWVPMDALVRDLKVERNRLLDGMESAWGIIANAGEGDWSRETDEWAEAAEKWRDEEWHPALDRKDDQ